MASSATAIKAPPIPNALAPEPTGMGIAFKEEDICAKEDFVKGTAMGRNIKIIKRYCFDFIFSPFEFSVSGLVFRVIIFCIFGLSGRNLLKILHYS